MLLKERISQDLKEAMKARDALRVDCLRLILAAVKNREIEKRAELDDAECMSILTKLGKQREESIEMYRKGGRPELADKEARELLMIKAYLPEALSAEELQSMVEQAVKEVGATGPKDMGAVMKVISPKIAGRADGRAVSEAVKALLARTS